MKIASARPNPLAQVEDTEPVRCPNRRCFGNDGFKMLLNQETKQIFHQDENNPHSVYTASSEPRFVEEVCIHRYVYYYSQAGLQYAC